MRVCFFLCIKTSKKARFATFQYPTKNKGAKLSKRNNCQTEMPYRAGILVQCQQKMEVKTFDRAKKLSNIWQRQANKRVPHGKTEIAAFEKEHT
jgi:hypothetical protein